VLVFVVVVSLKGSRVEIAFELELAGVRMSAGDEVSGKGWAAGSRISSEAACSHFAARNMFELL